MRLTYRPLPAVWPSGQRTPWNERENARFRASWTQTLELLERELRHLGVGWNDVVIVEAGYRECDLRLDGRPRANVRLDDPAVVINFESKHGPLRYGCDTYHDHQDNVRAIALADSDYEAEGFAWLAEQGTELGDVWGIVPARQYPSLSKLSMAPSRRYFELARYSGKNLWVVRFELVKVCE